MSALEILERIGTQLVEHPEKILDHNESLKNETKDGLKLIFDSIVLHYPTSGPLDELYTEGFDTEQIWEELELQNATLLRKLNKKIRTLLRNKRKIVLPDPAPVDKDFGEESSSNASVASDGSDIEQPAQQQLQRRNDESDDDETSDDDRDVTKGNHRQAKSSKKSSAIDDEFFRLEDMNAFVDEQERLYERDESDSKGDESNNEENSSRGEDSDDESEDESIDLFAAVDNEDDSDASSTGSADIQYADFFGSTDDAMQASSVQEELSDEEEQGDNMDEDADLDMGGFDQWDKMYKNNTSDQESDGEDETEDIHDEDDDQSHKHTATKTPLERQREQLAQQISELESEAMGDKHWALRGEVSSNVRPENSLLDAVLEHEHISKPKPVVTVETTATLEEMIKQRIRDDLFDDVEAKLPKTEAESLKAKEEERKALPELSTEKSGAGLGDVYAAEYMKRSMGVDEASEKEKQKEAEIKVLFERLLHKLDALTNFHFTPKSVVKELDVQVKPNVPTLSMEEILPTAVASGQQAAPEEVHKPVRGRASLLKSSAEMDPEERAASRRASKAVKRKLARQREREDKLLAKLNPAAANKYANKKLQERVAASGNVVKAKISEDTTSFGKSNQMFRKLQESAQQHINSKRNADQGVGIIQVSTTSDLLPKKRRKNKQSTAKSAAASMKL